MRQAGERANVLRCVMGLITGTRQLIRLEMDQMYTMLFSNEYNKHTKKTTFKLLTSALRRIKHDEKCWRK